MKNQHFDHTFIKEISHHMADCGIEEGDHHLIKEIAEEIASLLPSSPTDIISEQSPDKLKAGATIHSTGVAQGETS
ncbi:MAG: hypothetical protein HY731_09885 [Candidatus Tectomicrobia bacterium]|nr:hypothetical protein [Candidatus Tectomicrobia bacterium]